MPRKKILMWVCAIFAVSVAIMWALLQSDTLSNEKMSFIAMTQALSPARESASKCWREQQTSVVDCDSVRNLIPVSSSSDLAYLITDQGVLMGIDYSNRVTVLLTPRIDGLELNWRCEGSPSEAISKLCRPLQTGEK